MLLTLGGFRRIQSQRRSVDAAALRGRDAIRGDDVFAPLLTPLESFGRHRRIASVILATLAASVQVVHAQSPLCDVSPRALCDASPRRAVSLSDTPAPGRVPDNTTI